MGQVRKPTRTVVAALLMGTMMTVPEMQVYAMEETEVQDLSEQVGEEYNLCPDILQSIAWNESKYDETAEADGCIGLMQAQGSDGENAGDGSEGSGG